MKLWTVSYKKGLTFVRVGVVKGKTKVSAIQNVRDKFKHLRKYPIKVEEFSV